MIDNSKLPITDKIYKIVRMIPEGHVATYGQVAEIAGNPKMARVVGNALHKNKDPQNVPCYRVVNAQGKIAENYAFGKNIQEELLIKEGVCVQNGKVDLKKYGVMVMEGKFIIYLSDTKL